MVTENIFISEKVEIELKQYRSINQGINSFLSYFKELSHPDLHFLDNDEFLFLQGKFKFVRSLSLVEEIGMITVFIWDEVKNKYELIEKFHVFIYNEHEAKITTYMPLPGQSVEKAALMKISIEAGALDFLNNFFYRLKEKGVVLQLAAEV